MHEHASLQKTDLFVSKADKKLIEERRSFEQQIQVALIFATVLTRVFFNQSVPYACSYLT